MRPTGKLHLGNYMGALHNWVQLQESYDCFFTIVDWHALTTDYADPSRIADFVQQMALDWLAAGLDPEKCVIFVQSQVKQHAELHLLLSMITPLGWLERVPSYKDQQENIAGKDLTTYGFLGYPLLQSADILLYGEPGGSLHVPVGQDQVAHVEITREIARRFAQFSMQKARVDSAIANPDVGSLSFVEPPQQILVEPQVLLTPTPKLPGTDGRKMSKSYNNFILLTDPQSEIRKKLKPMVTDPARVRRSDPGNPDVCPVGDLHKVFSSGETIRKVYDGCTTAGIGCIECKGWLADAVVAALAPMQERRALYNAKPDRVREILAAGSARARVVAEETMVSVRAAIGLE